MPFKDVGPHNNPVRVKYSTVQGEGPTDGSLRAGELAVNIVDGTLFIGGSPGATPVQVSSGGGREYYVNASGLDVATATPPIRKQFKNDGTTGSDGALKFNSSYATMPAYTALGTAIDGDTKQFTVEFWIKPTRSVYEYVASLGSNAGIRLDNSGGNPALRIDFGSTYVLTQPVQIGSWNHILIAVDKSTSTMYLYVNGNASQSPTGAGTIAQQNPIEFGVGSQSSGTAEYFISEFTVYDALFDATQASERYNGGAGTVSLPSGITDANRVLYMDFSDATGGTITNTKGDDATIVGTEGVDYYWTTGPIGASGSFGVYLPAYEPGAGQYAGFTMSIPRDWTQGTAIVPHIHASIADALSAGETITFELEYTAASEDAVFGNTTTVTGTYTADGTEAAGKNLEVSWSPLDLTGITTYPQIVGTLKRRDDDTCHCDVFFINFGVEYTSSY